MKATKRTDIQKQPVQMKQKNQSGDLAEFCAPGCTWYEQMVPGSDNISLRVVTFRPPAGHHRYPVVMVPGLVSVMLTFKKVLIELTKTFIVHYVETREKSSSDVPESAGLNIDTIGQDIVQIISYFNLKEGRYILFGGSMGATAIINSYQYLTQRPFCLVLLEPNAIFDYPKWSLFIIRISAPLYPMIKPFAKWYLKNFRVNTEEDYEMYNITSRALDSANPYKLKNTVMAISKYQIWNRLRSVQSPALIVCASKDTFHRHDDIMKIKKKIKNSTYCDLEVHERTHSPEFVHVVNNYIRQLENPE